MMKPSTNIQSIKIKFIEEFAGLNNDALVKKLYDILVQEKRLAYEALLKPMSEEDYIARAIQANKDIKDGEVTNHEEFKRESENW